MKPRIAVVPHDPSWARAFDVAAAEIRAAVPAALRNIHHVGSTSIGGIYAKPVIDMLGVADDLAAVDAAAAGLEAIGYVAMGEFGIAGRRYFRRDNANGVRTHQLHVFQAVSAQVDRHLAFRDYMRSHPTEAEAYSALKQRLVAANSDDMEAYMDGKDPFIVEHLAKALAWAATRRA